MEITQPEKAINMIKQAKTREDLEKLVKSKEWQDITPWVIAPLSILIAVKSVDLRLDALERRMERLEAKYSLK